MTIRVEKLPHSRTEEVVFASKGELQLAVKLCGPFLEPFQQSDLEDNTYFTFRKIRNVHESLRQPNNQTSRRSTD